MPVLICLAILCLCSGCISGPFEKLERFRAERIYAQQTYQFNFARTSQTGTLEIRCVPPSEQALVSDYWLQIDVFPPVAVFKRSTTLMTLDAGPHTITAYAERFGSPITTYIQIIPGQKTTIEYIGPYWIWSKGSLKMVEI